MPHIFAAIDFVVCAYAVDPKTKRVLLGKCTKYDEWLAPGGHIELGETPDEALHREFLDETGLIIKLHGQKLDTGFQSLKYNTTWNHAPSYIEIHDTNLPGHRHVCLVHFATVIGGELSLPTSEHKALRWFTTEELFDPSFGVMPNIAAYGDMAIRASNLRRFSSYAIYNNPMDHPNKVVLRRFDSGGRAAEVIAIRETVDEIRKLVPPGLTMVKRHPSDVLSLVEVWI